MSSREGTRKRSPLKGKGGLVGVLVLVLLAIFLIRDLRNPVREPGENPWIGDFVVMRPEEVTRLEVREGDQVRYAVAKQGDQWRVEQPYQARADKERVESLIGDLLKAPIANEVPRSARDPAPFGLDRPSFEVILTAGRTRKSIRVGKAAPAGAFYAQIEGHRQFFVLDDVQLNALKNQKPEELRDLVMVTADRDSVREIVLQRPSGEIKLERKAPEEWELAAPFRAKAFRYSVSQLLSELASLRADAYVGEVGGDLARYGLDRPRLKVIATDRSGRVALLIGAEAPKERGASAASPPGYYSMREGDTSVYRISNATYTNLDVDTSTLRDRTLLEFERDRVERIVLVNPHGNFELFKRGDDWWIASAGNVRADPERVSQILSTVQGEAAKHIEENPKDLARYGLAQPAIRLTLFLAGGRTQQLNLGSAVPGRDKLYYASITGVNAVFAVNDFVRQDLDLKLDQLKEQAPAPAGNAPNAPASNVPGNRPR